MENYNQKISLTHLKRKAILYIRQSSMKQVFENKESTFRQYALKEKLISLGWVEENITTIDCDLGHSGADSDGREGFRQLVADVGSGDVGAVASIECSRLSRNSQDWGRLMEICAITQTVLIDADGVYNPNDFNDRLLLGLKGTMSEAELYFIRARMRGGALNKAKRGEYRIPLPTGYIYEESGSIIKDPNIEIQNAVELFFESFQTCGSAHNMPSYYRKNGFKIPKNLSNGFNNKDIIWIDLSAIRAVDMLHNPIYAGIYAYGQQQVIHTVGGKKIRRKPVDEWHVCIQKHHDSYISEAEYNLNQAKLKDNDTKNTSIPPVREGSALLQGIAICGKCGAKMSTRYNYHNGERYISYYVCDIENKHYGLNSCQYVHGAAVDKAVSDILLERLTPIAIANAIQVQKELEQRKAASDNYFIMKAERAKYEADLAKKRYMNVDPSNRLVAFELERLWNQKITELAKAEDELKNHENSKKDKSGCIDASKLLTLPDNVREIWNNGGVSIQDKKRILRCLVEDVTLTKENTIIRLGICLKGGAVIVSECANPPMKYTTWTTSKEVLDIVRKESNSHTSEEISEILTNAGHKSGKG
ncbi:MAG: recombinase family protein, partial [Endomicrobia bacterium]|nr:recombinase family protein [Endomicrobiia bacterium]